MKVSKKESEYIEKKLWERCTKDIVDVESYYRLKKRGLLTYSSGERVKAGDKVILAQCNREIGNALIRYLVVLCDREIPFYSENSWVVETSQDEGHFSLLPNEKLRKKIDETKCDVNDTYRVLKNKKK